MSGSQHNPNGRQAQLGSGWSPLQLQMANLLARAPQAHMASERGVTWHTPTPPPHLYHAPQPSPPDPLQAMKGAGNSVFRHTATPPDLYRHTPTPPDKHLLRHTPSPGDVKAGAPLPPTDMYAHLAPTRDKLSRAEELAHYARGVDLSLGARNGVLSVRDAPTINSLIARDAPAINSLIARRPHRLDSLLERLQPAHEHSVIVQARAHTPDPPDSNDDSADSTGAPPGSKRKRKPERTIRLPSLPPAPGRLSPALENGSALPSPALHRNGPDTPPALVAPGGHEALRPDAVRPDCATSPPPARRKTRSGSAETIDDIAAMIASTQQKIEEPVLKEPEKPAEPPVTIDKLKSVLASPETETKVEEAPKSPPKAPLQEEKSVVSPRPETVAAAPRRATRLSPATNVPVESPSEGKPAGPEPAHPAPAQPEPCASFVEVENQLEKMFAGIEEPVNPEGNQPVEKEKPPSTKARKRRKSAPTKGERKAARRSSRASTGEDKKKGKKPVGKKAKEPKKDGGYDSGSNASSSKSRGPYIQIRGPRASPLSVSVMNAATGEEEEAPVRRKHDFRNGLRARGLHCSTLGLRYDATTPDATWLCAFCERGPHASGLGDLFGPYPLETDCPEYRALDEATRRKYEAGSAAWLHEACAVWAPGLLAAGARLWGLAGAVWSCRGTRCSTCGRGGAALACGARACRERAHLPCAAAWTLDEDEFQALCPRHHPS